MKMFRKLIAICCSITLLAGCNISSESRDQGKPGNTELYERGLELISVMNEMVQSDEYAELIGADHLESVRERVDTDDYDKPVKVYSIIPPKFEEMMGMYGGSFGDSWDELPNSLKNQIKNRMTFSSSFSTSFNGTMGIDVMGFSTMYQASQKNDDFSVENEIILLYTFEEGTPILVSFRESGVFGQFLFLEDAEDTLSDLKSEGAKYKFKIEEIEI